MSALTLYHVVALDQSSLDFNLLDNGSPRAALTRCSLLRLVTGSSLTFFTYVLRVFSWSFMLLQYGKRVTTS